MAIVLGECNDDQDNDGDQLIDDDDPDCRDALGLTEEADRDGDGIPDTTDPFPNDPDNDLAQCSSSLGDCQIDLMACESDLATSTADTDEDGVRDTADACPGTGTGTDVDLVGCSLAQFCTAIDAGTPLGMRLCRESDWRNDESLSRPNDCILKGGGRQAPVCVPAP